MMWDWFPKTLGEGERSRLPGSFVRLSRGFVHYELSGPEDGPAVVLVPGLSVPYSTWDRNVPALVAAGFRVLRYEHYGRGFSDRPRTAYGLDLYAEQLVELVGALGLGRLLAVVGLSMGGPVSAAALVGHPGLASRLVLVDPLFEWPPRRGLGRALELPILGEAIMALRGRALLAGGQRGDYFDVGAFEDFIPSYLPPLEYRGICRAVLATLRSIPSWPLLEVYGKLGGVLPPTLLFWGREDETLPFEQSGQLLSLLPGTAFHPVEGAGHVPHWEKPFEVNDAILGFLRGT